MKRVLTPTGIADPAANYALGVETLGTPRWLHTSGIVGERPDGTISDDIGEQADEVWKSLGVILADAGMSATDVVSYTTYAVIGNDFGAVMAARDRFFGGHVACSTLVPVQALARPHWKVEVTLVAAR
jgi:2-iminobutanoate/2-iminopropanoate deaminase